MHAIVCYVFQRNIKMQNQQLKRNYSFKFLLKGFIQLKMFNFFRKLVLNGYFTLDQRVKYNQKADNSNTAHLT